MNNKFTHEYVKTKNVQEGEWFKREKLNHDGIVVRRTDSWVIFEIP